MNRRKTLKIMFLSIAGLITLAAIGIVGIYAVKHMARNKQYEEAAEMFVAGNYSAAEKILLGILMKDRNDERALTTLAEVLEKDGKWRKAGQLWTIASALNPFEQKYVNRELNAYSICQAFDLIIEKVGNPSGKLHDNDNAVELLAYSYLFSGKKEEAEETFDLLPESYRKESQLSEMIDFVLNIKNYPEQEKIEKFTQLAASPDQRIAFFANLQLLKYSDGNNEEKERILKNVAKINPECGIPLLGDFYFTNRRFSEAIKYYSILSEIGISANTAINYAEALAWSGNILELEKLSTQFKRGSKQVLMTGFYIDAIIAFLKEDYNTMTSNIQRLDSNIFNSPLSLSLFLTGYLYENNPPGVLKISRIIKNDPNLNYLHPYLLAKVTPMMETLYNEQRIEEAAPLAAILNTQQTPNLLFTRIVLLDQIARKFIERNDINKALNDFPTDPTVLDAAAIYSLQNYDYVGMMKYAEKNIESGNNSIAVQLQKAIALEGLNLLNEANKVYLELLEQNGTTKIAKQYIEFCVRNKMVNNLTLLLKRFQSANAAENKNLIPLIHAEIAMLGGDKTESIQAIQRLIAANLLSTTVAEDIEPLYRCARTLALHDEIDLAIKLYEELKPVYRTPALIMVNLSELYAVNKQPLKALAEAERAWIFDRNWSSSRECYGIRLSESGDFDRASMILQPRAENETISPRALIHWQDSMEKLIKKEFAESRDFECKRNCELLLKILPENQTAIDYLKKSMERQ